MQRKVIVIGILIAFVVSGVMMLGYESKAGHKAAFIHFMIPKINTVNKDTLATRKKIETLYKIWQKDHRLPKAERAWLQLKAREFGLHGANFTHKTSWQNLLSRVDMIPASLVLAQAIVESGWGQSHFAKEVNNYFGIHCHVPGCGIMPKHRIYSLFYELKRFHTPLSSVQYYMHTLNSHRAYQSFRLLRAAYRHHHTKFNGLALTRGLLSYSERGQSYVLQLQQVIEQNHLQRYDG